MLQLARRALEGRVEPVVVGLVLAFVLVSSDPPIVLFSLFLVYAVSGYVIWVLRWRSGRPSVARPPPPSAPPN